MSYNYKDKIIDQEFGSFQDKFLDYAHTWEDNKDLEKKRVKIILKPNQEEINQNITFENKINSYIEENKSKISIFDIKYTTNSVMIIYEKKSIKNV